MTRFPPLCLGLVWLALAPGAWAAEVVWDPNPAAERVVGYLVFFGPEQREGNPAFREYPHELDVGPATRLDLGQLTTYPDARFLSVVAYNDLSLRSDYSDEVDLAGGAQGAGGGGGGGGCFLGALAAP